jgi:hypothetical protein
MPEAMKPAPGQEKYISLSPMAMLVSETEKGETKPAFAAM